MGNMTSHENRILYDKRVEQHGKCSRKLSNFVYPSTKLQDKLLAIRLLLNITILLVAVAGLVVLARSIMIMRQLRRWGAFAALRDLRANRVEDEERLVGNEYLVPP
jgi:hypothetical protein